jgi:hypothetical protein
MSMTEWYVHKAQKCAEMAKDATDPAYRARFETEARLWLEIAADIEKDLLLHPGPDSK